MMRSAAQVLMVMFLLAMRSTPADYHTSSGAEPTLPTRAVGFYDATLRRVVIIGGAMQFRARARDGVWSWSGTRWEPVTDSGPPSRGNAGAAYDAGRRIAVFTGGARATNDSSFEIVGESWEGTQTGWRRIAGSDLAPRDHHSMVYDEDRETVLMFGGIPGDRATPWPTDTWELRPEGWTRLATSGPPGRARSAMAYDARRHRVVLFGGVGGEPAPGQPQPWFDDTWVLERTGWRKLAEGGGGPRARYAHGMVFDERAGVVLLYSGAAAHRGAPLSDMWKWDGERWTEIPLSGPTPGYRYQPVMVYDRARGRTVLYGGDPSKTDTWEWDGQRWSEIRP